MFVGGKTSVYTVSVVLTFDCILFCGHNVVIFLY
jgi:hypothetical protein